MRTLRAWFIRFGGLFNKEERDRELADEIESNLQMQIEDNVRAGMTPPEARRRALIKFGGMEATKEQYREQRTIPLLETLLQDVRFGARMLRKNAGFTTVAVLVLALGIGANSAIFSVVNSVLLKPLPYRNGERLVTIQQQAPRAGLTDLPFSVPEVMDYRSQNRSLEALVEYHSMSFILLGRAEPERIRTGVVSWNFFDVFGVKPLLGRTFQPDDEKPGAPAVLLLTYEYWIHSFGGDGTVVGRTFSMNDKVHTVIGVLPPLPQYPDENQMYMPTTACPFRSDPMMIADRHDRMVNVFGLMKQGVSVRQVSADLNNIAANLQRSYPKDYPAEFDYSIRTATLREELTHNARPTMLVLLAAAGFVLLIACANVANLNLSRMVRRKRELVVRAALGAGQLRLLRQLLTESFMLALLGSVLGLVFARGCLGLLVAFAARFTPRAREIHMDATVLLFTLVVAVLVSVVSGSIAALDTRDTSMGNLNEESGRTTFSKGRQRLRAVLIVSQIAVSFLLLIGAGLMLRSFWNLQHVDPGFQPENVLTMRLNLNFTKYNTNEKQLAFYEALLDKVRSQPGVISAATSIIVPLNGSGPIQNDFLLEGQLRGKTVNMGDFRVASPGYFQTLHIPFIAGRDFTHADRPGSQDVAIVNRTAARHFWGTQDPIGKRISTNEGKSWIQIVGIVGDVKQYGLDKDASDEIYVPLAQSPLLGASLVVKTAVEPMSIARRVIEMIYEIDPHQPAALVQSMDQVRAESIAAPKLTTTLLGLFALLALAIAVAGIGGMMALAVSQRTHEIGVRMAIGANPMQILRMVLTQGLGLTAIGVTLGLFGAMTLTHLLQGLLFEVTPTDPMTLMGVAGVLALAALGASYLPARRAAHVNPTVALRWE